jgi:hypothetical protein
MPLQLATGSSTSAFAIELLRRGAGADLPLSRLLTSADCWRKNYQAAFARLTCLEAQENGVAIQRELLNLLGEMITDPAGTTLKQLAAGAALASAERVQTVVIRGQGAVVPLATVGAPTADALIANQLAEPGIKPALESFDSMVSADADLSAVRAREVLVSLGANAELSIAPEWLGLGATVVAVARPNFHKWARLIETARSSAGTLILPVLASRVAGENLAELDDYALAELAGLDLESDTSAITAWLLEQATALGDKRFNLIGTIYAPGKQQILASAAQDAVVATLLAQLGPERSTVGWLATPLDSVLLPAQFGDETATDYAARSFGTRLRDAFWHLVGGLKPVNYAPCTDGHAVIADFSAQRQGSSYLLAKRIERWRAAVAAAEGYKVWYQVTPAAITHSTVGYKVVRAAYRGARKLGVTTFEPWMLRDLLSAMLIGHLTIAEPGGLVTDTAVHGGIWRLPYDPQTVWKPAALMGWIELLKPGK